ncbi:class II fructose-bisphosphate aldolase [Thermoflexus sp.]|uniref:class II fructose-bisphosphate aldolase n=1 Tax=Thermoflexus sp. TaxID=1969742 RepID=UPI0025D80F7B|nr:class II fructose-bisphosphate aldolase [Thermoflexus sp.]MCS6964277.1 class II fructose-bisphosphate aldolase [Thermoflexus sp.]MDW8185882.1 class II fructose-bisphosphate aldolase [Anaerolineae bacterium]
MSGGRSLLQQPEWSEALAVIEDQVEIRDLPWIRQKGIDGLVRQAVFGSPGEKAEARGWIFRIGEALGILPASIHELYAARGRGEVPPTFTVPAMNLRGMTYEMARAAFRAALRLDVGAMIFEIARSEISYTDQRPEEYAVVIVAAAIKEGFRGPLFLQGDHFQVSAKAYAKDPERELQAVRDLTAEAIAAGFYNIDIDTSTLVDLTKPTLDEQQRLNYTLCAELTRYIRSIEPPGVTISVGGEIGEVGGKNSTVEELRAFMDGYRRHLSDEVGISKISVQTGTTHGGVVLPDGRLAQVAIDFEALRALSRAARLEYGLAGAVQHGASTLPEEAFNKFVECEACEVHLATGFQNLVFDLLPASFREEIYAYLRAHHAEEWKPGETEEQFYYKARKRAWGPFKQAFWELPEDTRGPIREALEARFALLFERLAVAGTRDLVARWVRPVPFLRAISAAPELRAPREEVEGLAD